MQIFDFENYKEFVNQLLKLMPKRGRGQYRKIAQILNTHPVYVSQVFKGTKDLSLDQAFKVSAFLSLSELEREYFFALIQRERAATFELRNYYSEQLAKIRAKSQDLKNRIIQTRQLSEETKAVFYSNWHYSAVRLLSSIKQYQTLPAIALRLGLEESQVAEIVEFLLSVGLCVKEDARVVMGPSVTHLDSKSPFIKSRQIHWRVKGFQCMDAHSEEELFYTAPMSLSKEGVKLVRSELLKLIDDIGSIVKSSEAEDVACLNIDWFKF
ncbi:MAG: TIGR02147 family protein [Bdellovibrionota bacterium]